MVLPLPRLTLLTRRHIGAGLPPNRSGLSGSFSHGMICELFEDTLLELSTALFSSADTPLPQTVPIAPASSFPVFLLGLSCQADVSLE